MRPNLTDCIINHVFDNLGLTLQTKVSLKNDKFLINDEIEFIDEDGNDAAAKIWGCQVKIDSANFRLLVVDFLNNSLEHALIIKLDDCPAYACYLAIDEATGDGHSGLICFSLSANAWLRANIAIQGTFLSGMENLKDITGNWDRLLKYEDLLQELKSFIEYHENFSELESDE